MEGRLWPTGDVAWCHSAVAVTADTPHSEHWAEFLVPRIGFLLWCPVIIQRKVVATCKIHVLYLPSVQHDSGYCEKAGLRVLRLRPTQSPVSHWLAPGPSPSTNNITSPECGERGLLSQANQSQISSPSSRMWLSRVLVNGSEQNISRCANWGARKDGAWVLSSQGIIYHLSR